MAIKQKSSLEREKATVAHQLTIWKSKKVEIDRALGTCKKESETLRGQISEKEKSVAVVRARIDARADQLRREGAELDRINDDVYSEFCAELKIANISEFEGGSLKEHKERGDRQIELQSQLKKLQEVIQKLREQEKAAEEQEKAKRDEVEKVKREIDALKSDKKAKEKEIR
jgi:structural maintenance of chromosome 1